MRILAALALLTACGDPGPECDQPATGSVITRIELSGTCGPIRAVKLAVGEGDPPGCTVDLDRTSCTVSGHMTCTDGMRRDWWLDGTSGRWVGEDSLRTATCTSVYRMVIEEP